MVYSEELAIRIRKSIAHLEHCTEKEMMGGLAFMLNDKMCVGILKDELLCRIDPVRHEEALTQTGCREMDFTGKSMKGWIMVAEEGMKTKKLLDGWIALAIEFNAKAKKSKPKTRSTKAKK